MSRAPIAIAAATSSPLRTPPVPAAVAHSSTTRQRQKQATELDVNPPIGDQEALSLTTSFWHCSIRRGALGCVLANASPWRSLSRDARILYPADRVTLSPSSSLLPLA